MNLANHKNSNTVLFLDIDDTLWKMSKNGYEHDEDGNVLRNEKGKRIEKEKPLVKNVSYDPDIFIDNLADFIRGVKSSGIKICLTTQSPGKYGVAPLLGKFLRDNNLEDCIDSITSLEDLTQYDDNLKGSSDNSYQSLSLVPDDKRLKEQELEKLKPGDFSQGTVLSKYGKKSSEKLGEIALKKAGISPDEFHNLTIITMGDHPTDLTFSKNIKDAIGAKSAYAIHADVIGVSEENIEKSDKEMKKLKTEDHIDCMRIRTLRDAKSKIKNISYGLNSQLASESPARW